MSRKFAHGEVTFLDEIDENRVGRTVRVVGKLIHYEPKHTIAVLEEGVKVLVTTELLGRIDWRCGRVYQVIGEVVEFEGNVPIDDVRSEKVAVQARVEWNADGLDMKVYKESVVLRRRFEEEFLKLAG